MITVHSLTTITAVTKVMGLYSKRPWLRSPVSLLHCIPIRWGKTVKMPVGHFRQLCRWTQDQELRGRFDERCCTIMHMMLMRWKRKKEQEGWGGARNWQNKKEVNKERVREREIWANDRRIPSLQAFSGMC